MDWTVTVTTHNGSSQFGIWEKMSSDPSFTHQTNITNTLLLYYYHHPFIVHPSITCFGITFPPTAIVIISKMMMITIIMMIIQSKFRTNSSIDLRNRVYTYTFTAPNTNDARCYSSRVLQSQCVFID